MTLEIGKRAFAAARISGHGPASSRRMVTGHAAVPIRRS
jgi:hypothetical protein